MSRSFYNLELEKDVLGCMVRDNSIIVNVANYLRVEDFSQETNRRLFSAAISLAQDKKVVDITTLLVLNVAAPEYVATLSDVVATGSNWEFYAKKVKQLSLCRQFQAILSDGVGYDEESVLEKITTTAQNALKLADQAGASTKVKTFRDVMPKVCDLLSYACKHPGQLWGKDTGLNNLNEYISGIQNEYYLIAARPSQGKTTLGLQIAIKMARDGSPGVFFQLEMTDTAIALRAISQQSGVNSKLIKSGLVTEGTPYMRVAQAMNELREIKLAIEDKVKEIHEIAARIRYLVRCEGYQWAMIDHVSKITTKNNRVPRHEQYAEISGILQDLRTELNIPIIALAQLRRDAEGKMPTLADLRESGSFEQDADTIIFIHRDRETDSDEIDTDLFVAKQRDGAIGIAKTTFYTNVITFKDRQK